MKTFAALLLLSGLVSAQWVDVGQGLDPRRRLSVEGNATSDWFGVAVSSAGDVNGDGLADFAVSSPRELGGRVRVYHGGHGGVLQAFDGHGEFGSSLDFVGDTDLDGAPEILVGARFDGPSYHGGAYVLESSTGQVVHAILGQGTGSGLGFFGDDVAGLGDVNEDGHVDFAVGEPGGERVHVYSGDDGSVLHTLLWAGANDSFGTAVSSAGDVDMDGIPDILVGAKLAFGSGGAFVYSGRTGSLIRQIDPMILNLSDYGLAVTGVGDVDLDGYADYAVGAPREKQNPTFEPGSVSVYTGQTGDLLHKRWGEVHESLYGVSLAGGQDVDGDGLLDLAVGAPVWIDGLGRTAGRVEIVVAATGEQRHEFMGGADDLLGVVAFAGDVDGDGLTDLVTGSQQQNGGLGLAEVFDQLDTGEGQRPVLSGVGTLQPNQPYTLSLARARPNALTFGVLGFAPLAVDFSGGVMVPAVDVLVPAVTNANGRIILNDTWPTGLPLFTPYWAQMWIVDPVGPAGFSASNGLMFTTGPDD